MIDEPHVDEIPLLPAEDCRNFKTPPGQPTKGEAEAAERAVLDGTASTAQRAIYNDYCNSDEARASRRAGEAMAASQERFLREAEKLELEDPELYKRVECLPSQVVFLPRTELRQILALRAPQSIRRTAPRNRSSRSTNPRSRGSRRSSGGGGDSGDSDGDGDEEPALDDTRVAAPAKRGECESCQRSRCKTGEKTCAACRKRQQRERDRRGQLDREERNPRFSRRCECGPGAVALKDEDGEFICVSCGASVSSTSQRINGFDQHVWLMETAADGLPYRCPRRHLARDSGISELVA